MAFDTGFIPPFKIYLGEGSEFFLQDWMKFLKQLLTPCSMVQRW